MFVRDVMKTHNLNVVCMYNERSLNDLWMSTKNVKRRAKTQKSNVVWMSRECSQGKLERRTTWTLFECIMNVVWMSYEWR